MEPKLFPARAVALSGLDQSYGSDVCHQLTVAARGHPVNCLIRQVRLALCDAKLSSNDARLVVDDHPLFRDGFAHLAQALRPQWSLLFASNAAEAWRTGGASTRSWAGEGPTPPGGAAQWIIDINAGLPDDETGVLSSYSEPWLTAPQRRGSFPALPQVYGAEALLRSGDDADVCHPAARGQIA